MTNTMLKRPAFLLFLVLAVCAVVTMLLIRTEVGPTIQKPAASTKPQSLPATSTNASQELTQKQMDAAASQADAAWFQAWIAGGQAIITVLLFILTTRQIKEGRADRAELTKGRQLSLMPVLSCDIEYNPPLPVDAANPQHVPATLTLTTKNIGNAAALEVKPKIASVDSGSFNYNEAPISLHSSTLASGLEQSQPGVTIPHPIASGDTSTARRVYYYVAVDFVNVYKQKFITEAVYQTAHDLSGAAHWSKIAEQFFILDWDDKHVKQGGEEWARGQARIALKT